MPLYSCMCLLSFIFFKQKAGKFAAQDGNLVTMVKDQQWHSSQLRVEPLQGLNPPFFPTQFIEDSEDMANSTE